MEFLIQTLLLSGVVLLVFFVAVVLYAKSKRGAEEPEKKDNKATDRFAAGTPADKGDVS